MYRFLEAAKRLIVHFTEPLAHELFLAPHLKIPLGTLTFDHSFSSGELLECIKIISSKTSIRDLKIEEPEFEDVIHAFLEKETLQHTRLHQARNSK